MLNIDAIRNSMVNTTVTSSKKDGSFATPATSQAASKTVKTLDPSEAASMLYASGASGAARITFSEQNAKPLSIYDLTTDEIEKKLNEMASESQSISYDGMTDAEIFNSIVKRYMDKFGADLSVPNMSREYIDSGDGTMTCINSPLEAMRQELKAKLNDWENLTQIIQDANGYSGLSNSEIRARVREKYPEPNTIRDYMLMTWELQEMGVGSPSSDIKHILLTQICGHEWMSNPELEKGLWDGLLDTPTNFESLENITADFERNGKVIEIGNKVDFGSVLDSIGASSLLDSISFERLKEQLANILFDLLASRKE